jgi:hypothetical protein
MMMTMTGMTGMTMMTDIMTMMMMTETMMMTVDHIPGDQARAGAGMNLLHVVIRIHVPLMNVLREIVYL